MARTKTFDADQTLEKAMFLFWERGYQGTSMQDLVDRLGINRQSIYDTFGNKEKLFCQVLERYQNNPRSRAAVDLASPTADLEAIKGYFRQLPLVSSLPDLPNGCLFVNSTSEMEHLPASAVKKVGAFLDNFSHLLTQALERAKAAGQVPAATDVGAVVAMLTAVNHGMLVMSKSRATQHELEQAAAAVGAILP